MKTKFKSSAITSPEPKPTTNKPVSLVDTDEATEIKKPKETPAATTAPIKVGSNISGQRIVVGILPGLGEYDSDSSSDSDSSDDDDDK